MKSTENTDSSARPKVALINVGLYRSGSSTLAKAAEIAGFHVNRDFPQNISANEMKLILTNPRQAVKEWWKGRGYEEICKVVDRFCNHDMSTSALIGDGWFCLVPYLDVEEVEEFSNLFLRQGLIIEFLATTRDETSQVQSELHHWVVNNIENRSGLSVQERTNLEMYLHNRCKSHLQALRKFSKQIIRFSLEDIETWPYRMKILSGKALLECKIDWAECFKKAGKQNGNPDLPLEGILLTMRLGNKASEACSSLDKLITSIENDSLCRFMVVIALDYDETESAKAHDLKLTIARHKRIEIVEFINNPPRNMQDPFPICAVWNDMARLAYQRGSDWVVLLGDDIEIKCPFHYRALYRSFLDISSNHGYQFGFGCPWWNDESFPGFPTFPVVGKVHYEIFKALIPSNRSKGFVNQDLDPYLQRLYLQFASAPLIQDLRLVNKSGGNHLSPTRYERIPATGWRDWVLEDVDVIRKFLIKQSGPHGKISECVLLDVIVPSFRINKDVIKKFCCLIVPSNMRSVLIIVVDNPKKLCHEMNIEDPDQAALKLETELLEFTIGRKKLSLDQPATLLGENIRVRCNKQNMGASAARNRGIDESAAQYVLFLDDDVLTLNDLLLSSYLKRLTTKPSDCVGFVGLVTFPRKSNLPIIHGAILMSYLTFMFEIGGNPLYENPAWGVTANLLVKRTSVRFDTAYAKTGGGEDVDFCLRLLENSGGGQLYTAPNAQVNHDYWQGGIWVLFRHFFNWAIGDGALFRRYPDHCYVSYPNVVEFFVFYLSVWMACACVDPPSISILLFEVLLLVAADVCCDILNTGAFQHRCQTLGEYKFSILYYLIAHTIANIYVIVLESGRFYGHCKRGEIFENYMRRFDWLCGRLKASRQNFIRMERKKFILFVLVSFVNIGFLTSKQEFSILN